MKNLKKVLCLALVFAMAFGLMISANAFTDEADIENSADAALLNSLQIMTGRPDGTFDPDGFLTRAEVAKMIYVARTGGIDDKAVLFKGASNLFTDVKGHWGEGYINYAAAKSFVSGRGNGKYDPNATITGFELLKIALTSLGYNSEKQGFTGANWKMNVAAAAIDAGLITGYAADPNLPITRDDAAKIFANLIYSSTVGYDIYGVLSKTNKTFGVSYLNLTAVEGVVLENDGGIVNSEGAIATANAGKTRIDIATVNGAVPAAGAALSGAKLFSVATDADALGQTVVVYVKGESTTAVYGNAVISAKNTVVNTSAGMGPAADDTTPFSLRKYAKDNGVQLVAATKYIELDAVDGGADKGTIAAGLATFENGGGHVLKLIDNTGDGVADYAIKAVKSIATVTGITAKKTATGVAYNEYIGATGLNSLNTIGEIAKFDTILYYLQNGKYHATVAKTVTGKATGFSAAAGALTVAGSTLVQSALAPGNLISTYTLAALGANTNANDYNPYTNSFVYFVDDGGYVFKIIADVGAVSNTYAVLLDAAYVAGSGVSGSAYAEARLLFTDGTTEIVKLASITDDASTPVKTEDFSKVSDWTSFKGKIYSYSVSAITGKYVLTEVSATETATIGKGASLIDGTSDFYGTANTIYLVQSLGGTPFAYYTVYTGYANIPAVSSHALEIMPVVAGSPVASIVYISGGVVTSQASYNAYVVSTATNYVYVAGGTSYYTMDAIIGGEKSVLKLADTISVAEVAAIGWYEFTAGSEVTISSDNIVTLTAAADPAPVGASKVDYVGNNTLVLSVNKAGGYTYSDSTAVWLIDSITKAVTVTTVDAIAVGDNINFVLAPIPGSTAVTTIIVMK